MSHLKLVRSAHPPPQSAGKVSFALNAGYRLALHQAPPVDINEHHGVIGDYRITPDKTTIYPVDDAILVWDQDAELPDLQVSVAQPGLEQPLFLNQCQLQTNTLVLDETSLGGPDLPEVEDGAELSLTAEFSFIYYTHAWAARLGVIHLVHSTRFLVLDDGEKVSLLETPHEAPPVLYLESAQDRQAIKDVSGVQEQGLSQLHRFSTRIKQSIPDRFKDKAVETVTVLEQYTSYIMHRADDESARWIPAHAPINWGWSIRVGRRIDGIWGITRRKLMLPTAGNEGLTLPEWNSNTLAGADLYE